jgi:hypothetical protein
MRGAVMRASEKQRVQFIRCALGQGADVVFTSAQLVKEGIDLLELPTLVWYAAEYNIYLSIDDLPPLVSFAPELDVQITVQTSRPARVRVTVQVEDLRAFQQLSLFGERGTMSIPDLQVTAIWCEVPRAGGNSATEAHPSTALTSLSCDGTMTACGNSEPGRICGSLMCDEDLQLEC